MEKITNSPVIYYRKSLMDDKELASAKKYFHCVDLISDIEKHAFVIPRMSLYPFVNDQLREIKNIGAHNINTYEQHLYVADLKNYVADLGDFTPTTWNDLSKIPDEGPFILKGETNSKKSHWYTHMFAQNKKEAGEVYSRLCADGLIGDQTIYIRKYEPLVTYMTGIGGVPVSKEFRFFIAYGQILTGAYYWDCYTEDLSAIPDVNEVPKSFLQEVVDIVGNKNNFYVIDVAQKTNGDWIVIELNSGSMSGLSANNPEVLYKNLKRVLENK